MLHSSHSRRVVAHLAVLTAAVGAIVMGGVAPAQADTDDFSFSSFDAHYDLSRDAGGHAELSTVETLVADFPEIDQNHGIVRQLVDDYDGHPTDLDVTSVTDATGTSIPYDTDSGDGYLTLQIGDPDSYAHGTKTYVISYTQKYVTRYFSSTNDDEFYWDTNGTGWAQPFAKLTGTVTIAPDLVPALTGEAKAFGGLEGADDLPVSISLDGGTATFSADRPVGANENVSFAIGFKAGTFTERPTGFFDSPLPTLALLGVMLALAGLVVAIVLRRTALADAPGRGTIIAEYVPPKGVSLAMSAVLLGRTAKFTSAMIIDLAVRGNLRISEVTEGRRKPSYRLDYLTTAGLGDDEMEFMHALFGPTFESGESHSLTTNDASAARLIARLVTRVTAEATLSGYRKPKPWGLTGLVTLLAVASVVVTWGFSFAALDGDYAGNVPFLFIAASIVFAIPTIILLTRRALTAKGTELREYLDGLKVYIDLAEEDRLRYLQSPQGAERTPIPTDDTAEVVKLNEKLLPYAVLFGNERKWAEELCKYYEQTNSQPGWYYGPNVFNAYLFASTIGSIQASAARSFTVPSTTSSSSGGTGGGGFSGGGGGGGGGGGW